MDKTMKYWWKLRDDFTEFLRQKGYSKSSLTHYHGQIDFLIRFANARNYRVYTPAIGQEFLDAESRLMDWDPTSLRFKATVIRRLDEYQDHEKYTFARLRCFYICPEQFRDKLEEFLDTLKSAGLKEITIKSYRTKLTHMLQFFSEKGIESWDGVNISVLQEAFNQSENKALFLSYAKRFFDFLSRTGVVKADYSGILPPIRQPHHTPSVYTDEEINAMLSSVDTETAFGKRDYAILLLALLLGMRASDIRLLCIENIDFEKKTISYVQFKTGVSQTLRLLPKIEDAIQDYLTDGRPTTRDPHVFLTYRGTPLTRSSVSVIADKYFRAADINFKGRHHGSHALRMTFASQLVAEQTPFEVVSKLLGHDDEGAISHYVALSTEGLRTCSLPTPAATGKFAAYLMGKE